MNPPFSLLPRVVKKISEDRAHGILIIPDWPYTRWFKELIPHMQAQVLFEKGARVFELNGQICKGVRWPTRAVLFCGHTPLCQIPPYRSSAKGGLLYPPPVSEGIIKTPGYVFVFQTNYPTQSTCFRILGP